MKEKPRKDSLKRSSSKREGGTAFLGFALVWFFILCKRDAHGCGEKARASRVPS